MIATDNSNGASASSWGDKIKALGLPGGIILILGTLVQLYAPWWSIALVCAAVGLWQAESAARSFAYGFAAVFVMWSVYAGILNGANGGIVANSVAQLLGGKISGSQLVYLTGTIGGLVGGLSAMTGTLLRQVF